MNRCSQVVAVTLTLLGCGQASAQDRWQYELIPLLWASSIEGREGVGGVTIEVQEDFDDLVEFVDVGGAVQIVARRAPIAWFAEASYVVLEDIIPVGGGAVRAELTQVYGEAGRMYEFREQLAAYGALRYQRLDVEFTRAFRQMVGMAARRYRQRRLGSGVAC